jgi:MSHA biogenesis protein MshP
MRSGCIDLCYRNRQSGVSVIAAIFLLLLMAVLAGLLVNLTTTTNVNMASDIGGSRAYQAARAGVEWGMFNLDPNAENVDLPRCNAIVGVVPVIENYQVEVVCVPFPSDVDVYREGGRRIRIFQITATATAPVGREPRIQRQVVVTIEKCRDSAISVAPFDC